MSASRADVVVIGGGLAGLAAAHTLRDRDVLVLEREPRLGGRVHTVGGVDLGACFALPAAAWPPGFEPPPRLPARDPLAIVWRGQTYSGETAEECLEAMSPSADREPIVRALFRQIHPGNISDYVPKRQKDAFRPIYPDYFAGGNQVVVAAWASGIRCETGREVTSLEERTDHVLVTHDGGFVEAKAVILATPATVARALVQPEHAATSAFLSSVRYATYTVVGLTGMRCGDLRYVLNPLGAPDVIIQQGKNVICYFEPEAFVDVETTVQSLRALGFTGEPSFFAVERWPLAGTVIHPDYARAKVTRDHRQATPRIFLAGDYMSPDQAWGYGTADAVASGRSTADLVRARFFP